MSIRLAVCGYGRSGKDTVGKWLHENTSLVCRQSTSEAAADLVFREWGRLHFATKQECWLRRHLWRDKWAEIIWRYNQPNGLTLYWDMVNAGNSVLVGIRNGDELTACVGAGVVTLSLWVERKDAYEGVGSMTLRREDCDLVILNNGTLDELYARLRRFAGALGVLRKE